jgi:flagellar assembly protein FliH
MNSSKDFSPSELDRLSRWKLPAVKDTREPPVNQSSNSQKKIPALPTVNDIEQMQRMAFEEASKQGWQEGYEKGLEQGRTEGLEQGRKKGLEDGRAELDLKIHKLQDLIGLLVEPLKKLDLEVEEELVALAVSIARQLVRRELKTENDQIVAVVRESVRALPAYARKVKISIHPDDAELVRSALHVDDAKAKWELQEDPLLTRGGCRVDTETSRIDATVENRLNQVIAAVLGGERRQDSA